MTQSMNRIIRESIRQPGAYGFMPPAVELCQAPAPVHCPFERRRIEFCPAHLVGGSDLKFMKRVGIVKKIR